jgi:two-component system, NarL family, nitrate/nitrite response regulator NarL
MRLLLCDDHRLFTHALTSALEAHGHEVIAAVNTAAEAVSLASELRPDVCLMDLNFPAGFAMEAIRDMSEQGGTKVLVLSGSAAPGVTASVLEAGAYGYVGKDQPVEVILRALERIGNGELFFDPAQLRAGVRHGPRVEGGLELLIAHLTPRERQVLSRLIEAETTSQIASNLGITRTTARAYVQSILTKLGVHSRLQAVALVTQARDVDLQQSSGGVVKPRDSLT